MSEGGVERKTFGGIQGVASIPCDKARRKVVSVNRRLRWRMGLLAVAGALIATACAPTSQVDELEAQVAGLESEVSALSGENSQLARKVSELESALGSLVEALPAAVDQSDVQREIDVLRVDVDEAIDLATNALDVTVGLASCVNDYMDTIARWSSNISTFYEYYYC
jgi:hypothetical protein